MANLVGLAEKTSIFYHMEDLQRLSFLLVRVFSQTFADFYVLALRPVCFGTNAVRLGRDALQLEDDVGADLERAKLFLLGTAVYYLLFIHIRVWLVKLSFSLAP